MCRPGSPTAPPDLTELCGVTMEAPFIDHRVGVGRSCEHDGLKGNTCTPLQPQASLGGTCGEAREAGEEQERTWERRPPRHRNTRLAAWPRARSCLQAAQETGGGRWTKQQHKPLPWVQLLPSGEPALGRGPPSSRRLLGKPAWTPCPPFTATCGQAWEGMGLEGRDVRRRQDVLPVGSDCSSPCKLSGPLDYSLGFLGL